MCSVDINQQCDSNTFAGLQRDISETCIIDAQWHLTAIELLDVTEGQNTLIASQFKFSLCSKFQSIKCLQIDRLLISHSKATNLLLCAQTIDVFKCNLVATFLRLNITNALNSFLHVHCTAQSRAKTI